MNEEREFFNFDRVRKAIDAGCESSYVPVDDVSDELVCETTPEDILIKKQMFLVASDEAKTVLRLILNAPPNIISAFLWPNRSVRISTKKVKKYLRLRTQMTHQEIEVVFEEIKLRLALA